MIAGELLKQDQLSEAIRVTLGTVKKKPTDEAARYLLGELLCLGGELARADKQFDLLGQQHPKAAVRVALIRQLIRAEQARQQFFSQGRLPEFVADADELIRLHLDATIALREGKRNEAAELVAKAEQQRPPLAGNCDGIAFDDFRDLDDLTACFFEVLTSGGKYYLLPMAIVERIEFHPVTRPLDLLWREARVLHSGGSAGDVFIPTIYPSTYQHPNDSLLLGSRTDWLDESPPIAGVGHRMFLVGDEDRALGEIKTLEFTPHH